MKNILFTAAVSLAFVFSAGADEFTGTFQPAVIDGESKKMVLRDDPVVITENTDGSYKLENNEWTGVAHKDKASGVYRCLFIYRSKAKDSSRTPVGPQFFKKNLVGYSTFSPSGKGQFDVVNTFHVDGKEIQTSWKMKKAK